MRAIPRIMLKDNVVFSALGARDRDGNGTFAAAIHIFFVHCEPVKEYARKLDGDSKDDKLKLFYDYVNSSPTGINFKQGDKISYRGQDYFIRTIYDYPAHHAEIMLK
jgi:hypothetical protein